MSVRVFVSYSREDAWMVRPVVELLRATKDNVFHDADSIKPGRQWKYEIENAISQSGLVVVFWCRHSASSTEVASECEFAVHAGKDVVPLLLDRTELRSPLDRYQWVDFREVAGAAHDGPAPAKAASRGRLAAMLLLAAAVAAGVVAIQPLPWGRPLDGFETLWPLIVLGGLAGTAGPFVAGVVRRRSLRAEVAPIAERLLKVVHQRAPAGA